MADNNAGFHDKEIIVRRNDEELIYLKFMGGFCLYISVTSV